MRLRHLRYFIVVAEELSFIQASMRLHIEPSPLSRAIKDLEYDVGTELLHRSKGKIRLTAAGEAFCKDARRLLALYDDAKKSARRIKDGSRGHLRIGIADSLAQPRLTRLSAMCREDEPLTPIGILEMTTDELLFGLKRDLIDTGFTMDGEEIDGFVKEVVWLERPVVALPRQHPLQSFDRIPFKEILRYPLILPHPGKCAGGYKLFHQWLHAGGFPSPLITEYVSGHEPMMMLVAAGYGIGFGLESQAMLYDYPDIVIRPVTEELASAPTFIVTSGPPYPRELERFIVRARQVGGLARPEGCASPTS
ncbi:LysR substrate-binding domain-containing protein [Shinella sp.]|uniref:LysR family transcriptional regulator n=1 Tax=Shinella sp. TaxID=1870904 RepID=UPI00258A2904|nr:LysR substrate-binding domain-containing protein [Shinella sp.]MCW5707232.1 LysR family transcriptional regulator [Shinella sp.]